MNFLITAGPTREALDPVRFLSNASSGKMGFAIARSAVEAGHSVTLVHGPVALSQPDPRVHMQPVVSCQEMLDKVSEHFALCDVLVMSAAVCDYRAMEIKSHKIKKSQDQLTLTLQKNPDILQTMSCRKEQQMLVGFAAETDHLVDYAQKKLQEKNLDMIVANNVLQEGAGFDLDTNIAEVLFAGGAQESLPLMSKQQMASKIVALIENHWQTCQKP